jgi:transcriptional antiterminator RfaH
MGQHWYALRSKPRKEDTVWLQLNNQEIEGYFPRIRVHPINPRSKKVKPYFPGYLFVKVDLDEKGRSTFKWMPNTLGLVAFGGEPAIVPENLIHALKKRVNEINEVGGEVFDNLQSGDKIRIHDGPFSGFEAIFDSRIPGKARVQVLLEFLGNPRRVPLELNASQISKND